MPGVASTPNAIRVPPHSQSVGHNLLAAAAALALLESPIDGLESYEAARRLVRDGPMKFSTNSYCPHGCIYGGVTWTIQCVVDGFGGAVLSECGCQSHSVIGAMVALSTIIRFVQEGRSHRATESLRAMVSNTAMVIRCEPGVSATVKAGKPQEIALCELVEGDMVSLSAGDMIPADCRILKARDLFVAQSAMTVESLPVEKFAQATPTSDETEPSKGLLAQRNVVFMGTNVVSGTAQALVVAIGGWSYFGMLAAHAAATETTPNAFQAGVNSASRLLIRFAAAMVPTVFFVNGFTKGDWREDFLFAFSVAVGLTSEMLPMIVTSTLAKGAVVLSRKKVVDKRLDAIQNFGAMDMLCTDKPARWRKTRSPWHATSMPMAKHRRSAELCLS